MMNKISKGAALLRKWLDKEELSHAAAAELLQCSPAAVGHWGSGVRLPSLWQAIVIEDVTGIPPRAWFQEPKGRLLEWLAA